jgi:hypothetical protein
MIHFMRTMADAVFKYGQKTLDKWRILSNCQSKMVFLVFELPNIMWIAAKEVLCRWRDDYNEFHQLL